MAASEVTLTVELSALLRLGNRLEAAVERVLDGLNDSLTADARGRCPVKTGFLRESISGTVTGPLLVFVAAASYAGFLEYGTRHMAPRVFFTPAVEKARSDLPELLQAAFRRAGGNR